LTVVLSINRLFIRRRKICKLMLTSVRT